MAGLFPIMMFALPAIAFAIIQEAREDLKPKVKNVYAVRARLFLTGVSEQIEFAFLFASPYLYVLHALMAGFAMVLTYAFDIHHGFSYSAGFIDYVLNFHLSQNAWIIIPIGAVYGIVYYFLFRWAIRTFEIPTPGREEGSALEGRAGDIPYQAPLILEALGGKDNIVQVQSCMTRLRLTVYNDRQIDSDALKLLGSAGIIKLGGGNVQVVFGTYSELIREEINKLMQQDLPRVLFSAPVQGRMLPIDEVPDDILPPSLSATAWRSFRKRGACISGIRNRDACLSDDACHWHFNAGWTRGVDSYRDRYLSTERTVFSCGKRRGYR